MFDENEAIRLLEKDRREYILKTISLAQWFIDRNMDHLAADIICEAATGLRQVDGSLQYLEQLKSFNKEGYPRFGTVLD